MHRDWESSQSQTSKQTDMSWSKYQENIFRFVKEGKGSAVVSAVAGSGKTTTIVECAKRFPSNKRVLFLAFNKSIAFELSQRLKDYKNVQCKTIHALGLSALAKAYKGINIDVQDNKWPKYVNSVIDVMSTYLNKDTEKQERRQYIGNINELLDLCRVNLVQAEDWKSIMFLARHHNIMLLGDEIKVVSDLLEIVYVPNQSGIIDFIDMITLPIMNESINKNIFRFDFVFIDECQDLNRAQRELMLSSVNFRWGGRFLAVGDRQQAINGFCGASCESFNLLAKCAKGNELPLSVNYRCGSEIVKLAKDIVPQIEAHEGAEEGRVEYVDDLEGVKANDMILCRLSAPLVSLCLKMLANNIPSFVKGAELGSNLLKLVERLEAKTPKSLMTKLEKELDKVRKDVEKDGVPKDEVEESAKVVAFKDKIACIKAFADTCKTIAEVKGKMSEVFSDIKKNNAVCLSTVHKSKGLEADRVFIILPHKLPLSRPHQQDWEYEQEMNLKYVAITRAKKYLAFVTLGDEELGAYEFGKKKEK